MYTNQIIFLFSKKKNLNYNFKKKLKFNNTNLKPNRVPYYKQYDFFNLLTYYNNGWKLFRVFFGFSIHAKTRTNSISIKNASLSFKKIILFYVFKKRFLSFYGKDKLLVLHLEFLNKLWFFQWKNQWENAREHFYSFLENPRKKFKFGVYFAKKNKGLNFITRPPKKNKKKVVIPQDHFNIGFMFNFTRFFKKQIRAGKSVKNC